VIDIIRAHTAFEIGARSLIWERAIIMTRVEESWSPIR
jgi:hypothetical protein